MLRAASNSRNEGPGGIERLIDDDAIGTCKGCRSIDEPEVSFGSVNCNLDYLMNAHLLIPLIVEIPEREKLCEFCMLSPAPVNWQSQVLRCAPKNGWEPRQNSHVTKRTGSVPAFF